MRRCVFLSPEVGERQIEPHPRQGRVTDQHGAESGDGGLPILPCHLVYIPLSQLNTLEQKLRVLKFTLGQCRPGGLDRSSRTGNPARLYSPLPA